MSLPSLVSGFLAALVVLLFPATGFSVTIVDRPLDPAGYGYTSHEGEQQIFDHFELGTGALINHVSWYGQFSDGLQGNNQTVGNFNIFLFGSDPEGETISPEGVITTGTPSAPILILRSQSSNGTTTGIADPLQGGDIKLWELEFPELYLNPGKYWICISAALGEAGYYLWNHSSGVTDGIDFGGVVSPSNEPRIWSSSSVPERDSMAFSIAHVPDASSGFVLLSMAMAALFGFQQMTRRTR